MDEVFKQWLLDNQYQFWRTQEENEVWINTKFTVIWHPNKGLRYQIANEDASEEMILSLLN
jgi:hypothetical protein